MLDEVGSQARVIRLRNEEERAGAGTKNQRVIKRWKS
jgi:hypothetical protein